MTKQEATKEGKALLARMKGSGWKVRVWENLGWRCSVYNGPIEVYVGFYNDEVEFSCLMGDMLEDDPGMGSMLWHDSFHSKDPNKVVKRQVKKAREKVDELDMVVRFVEEVMGKKLKKRG